MDVVLPIEGYHVSAWLDALGHNHYDIMITTAEITSNLTPSQSFWTMVPRRFLGYRTIWYMIVYMTKLQRRY